MASEQITQMFEDQEGPILSFASFGDEIDLWPLNRKLAEKNQLVLPRVEQGHLTLYEVEDLNQLILSSWGILEPPKDKPIAPEKISLALIPGLGFDRRKHRIGYGKGYYDRLLPKLIHAKKIGLGYQEQLLEALIPTDPEDHSLDELSLL